jgi:hypothetical protein
VQIDAVVRRYLELFGRSLNTIAEMEKEHITVRGEYETLVREGDHLVRQRDELMQERDRLLHERDMLVRERAAIVQSTSWKITSPIRFMRRQLLRLLRTSYGKA